MPLPTLEMLRKQCRIDEDNELENDLLLKYLGAARKQAEIYINRALYDKDIPDTDPDGVRISEDIELALMLAVNHFYVNRDPSVMPNGVKVMLGPYRLINV
ncbi:head-tail connector protein [Leminorella grimontii]|uniref:head-tail connector protein n=1 Tax=Leminorella grimontii TaxID=82981 RepID=UPI003220769B